MHDRSSYIQANINGRLCDAREPAISPLDRGFLYGDAAYEVWRSYHGRLFALDEHWQRLERTAEGLALQLPFGRQAAFEAMRATASAWREATGDSSSDLYLRLQITRGGGPIGLDTALADEATFAVYVKAQAPLTPEACDQGLQLHLCRQWARNSMQALPPTLKTGNYLNNILGLREAREAGADDALFLNAQGRLTEASTRNLWLVFKDRIVTPPVFDGLLAGVTRLILLETIRECDGRPLIAETLTPDQLAEADECFLSSTTQDVQPVAAVDDRRFAIGARTVTRRLKDLFAEHVAGYAKDHPQLAL